MGCGLYAGWCSVASAGGGTLPFLSGSVNRIKAIYKPVTIGWGLDAKNRSPYNYAIGSDYVEANFTCEIFANAYASIGALIKAGVNGTQINVSLASGGGSGVTIPGNGSAYVSSFTLNGNNSRISTVTFNLISTDATTGGGGGATLDFESAGLSEDSNPVSWYNTSFVMGGVASDMVMEWSVTFNNNPQMINVLNGQSEPIAIRLGTSSFTGSVTYLTTSMNKIDDGKTLTIDCGAATLTCPWLVITNDSQPASNPNQVVTRNLSFEGFGSNGNKILSA